MYPAISITLQNTDCVLTSFKDDTAVLEECSAPFHFHKAADFVYFDLRLVLLSVLMIQQGQLNAHLNDGRVQTAPVFKGSIIFKASMSGLASGMRIN